jgi:hypothetical protein
MAFADRRYSMKDLPLTGTEPITTSVEHRYGVAVLAVVGEIDMVTAPLFEKPSTMCSLTIRRLWSSIWPR